MCFPSLMASHFEEEQAQCRIGIRHVDSRCNRDKKRDRTALEAGFRHLDCAERYRNEEQVGEAIQQVIQAGLLTREDLFITTKLWNNNHRPERVQPAFDLSLDRLQLDYIDLYLIHTPFAFQPEDNQDPRDQDDNVIYDKDITLINT